MSVNPEKSAFSGNAAALYSLRGFRILAHMRHQRKTMRLALGIAIAALGLGATPAPAEPYPNKPIRIIVPYVAGGGVSVLAQIVGSKLSELVKQPVIIENRPGAGGNIGADTVAKSPPDGYTIPLHTSAMASARALYRTLPFDPVKDFTPVTMVVSTQFVLGGRPRIRPRHSGN